MTSIKDVFENKLKIDSKTVSIDSLFNNEDRKKILIIDHHIKEIMFGMMKKQVILLKVFY